MQRSLCAVPSMETLFRWFPSVVLVYLSVKGLNQLLLLSFVLFTILLSGLFITYFKVWVLPFVDNRIKAYLTHPCSLRIVVLLAIIPQLQVFIFCLIICSYRFKSHQVSLIWNIQHDKCSVLDLRRNTKTYLQKLY